MNVNLSTAILREKDAAFHFHPFTDNGALKLDERRIIVRADGVWLWDSEGNRILDGMAGLWCVNVGHGRPEIIDAVRSQMSELSYYNTFFKTSHQPVIELSEMLVDLAPPQFEMVFYGTSGSDGNDTVLRMVRTYWAMMGKPEKQVIISRHNAYHGSSMVGAALGGMSGMHEQAGTIPGIEHIAQPYWLADPSGMTPDEFGIHAARALEAKIDEIGGDKIAAFIAEPIQGAGGVIIPPDSYWPEVKRILKDRDILFVSDEVICGFGRTGNWFGCETFDTEPDLMTTAKGLTSGYVPLGAVMVSKEIAEVFRIPGNEFNHGYTYSGHPVSCAAAIANLKIIKKEKLVSRVADDIGPYLQKKWRQLADHPLIGEAVMTGLMGALELVPDKKSPSRRFENEGAAGTIARDFSFKSGLIMRAVRDRLILSPPLTLSHEEADTLIRIARKTLDDTHHALIKQELMKA